VVKSATSNSYWLLKRQRERERETEIDVERENSFQQKLSRNKYRVCGGVGRKRAADILAARRRCSCVLNVEHVLCREEGK
jgi:hypothetical protein